jgi:type I restriction enzyme M protein
MPPRRRRAAIAQTPTTVQRLHGLVKSCRDTMRKDKGLNGDLDRLPQLTWLMFLRFLDDLEKQEEVEAVLRGATYLPLIPEPYRWRDWAESDLSGPELLAFISNEEVTWGDERIPGLFARLRELGSGEGDRRDVVARVFSGTFNRMTNGYLLRELVDKLQELNFNSSDELSVLGGLYEGLLKEMRDAAGDSGEFYTPRPVVRFMIQVLDPKLGERVLDPAAGTGGFLVEAYEYLRKQVQTAPDRETLQRESVFGVEAKSLPYLLGEMNLLLHGVETPNIELGNSLAVRLTDIGDKDRYSVIATNPPFGGEEESGIKANFPPDKQSSETAFLFLQLIMRRLARAIDGQAGGRAAVVVPDGTLYATDAADRIKAQMLTEFNLHTIVRLPWGVFSPYTPTPTNLLFFDRSGPTRDIWYYQMTPPPGMKRYSKTKPLKFEEFEPLLSWWGDRTENEHAWRVSVEDVLRRDEGGRVLSCDLDLRHPDSLNTIGPVDDPDVVVQRIRADRTRLDELFEEFTAAALDVLPARARDGVLKTLSALWSTNALPGDKGGFAELASQLRRIAFAGMLNEEGEQVALGSLGVFLNGRSYDAALAGEQGRPIIRISNMTDPTAPYLRTTEDYPSDFHIVPGDLLASWSASFKTTVWQGPEGMLNQHIFKVTPEPGVSRDWLRHAIEASYQDMRRKQVGMGMFHLRRKDFLGHPVPELQFTDQENHAARLDILESAARRLDAELARSRELHAELVLPALAAAAGVQDSEEGAEEA